MQDPDHEKGRDCVDCGCHQETNLYHGPALLPAGYVAYLCPTCHQIRASYYRAHGAPMPLPSKDPDEPQNPSSDDDPDSPQKRCCP